VQGRSLTVLREDWGKGDGDGLCCLLVLLIRARPLAGPPVPSTGSA
jgi:hypothetical protein